MRPEGAPEGGGGDPNRYGMPVGGFNAGNFGAAPAPYQAPTVRVPAPYHAPSFTAPTPYQAPIFTGPTDVTMANDPGYQFRLKEGQRTVENAAAARGSVLSGGTLKALDRYNQDYASGEFGNVYNRARDTFDINTGVGLQAHQINAGNLWKPQELGAHYGLTGYQTNVDAALKPQELGAQYGLTGYQTNVSTQRNVQQDYWSRLRDLYFGGLQAAPYGYQRPPGYSVPA